MSIDDLNGAVTPGAHASGAIVVHRSPFSSLEVPILEKDEQEGLRLRWVMPFYRLPLGDALFAAIHPVWSDIDASLVSRLLACPDWRPRIVAGAFAALKRLQHCEDQIGRLLLRSDVCEAGRRYCLALATFNTPSAIGYLTTYLDYYLTQPQLWFEQHVAMAALGYLDGKNGTRVQEGFRDRWAQFASNKPQWDLATVENGFACQMAVVDAYSGVSEPGTSE